MQLFVLPYPVIDPVAIEFGPVSLRWYGLAYMAGILLGWLYGRYLVSRPALWGGKPPMKKSNCIATLAREGLRCSFDRGASVPADAGAETGREPPTLSLNERTRSSAVWNVSYRPSRRSALARASDNCASRVPAIGILSAPERITRYPMFRPVVFKTSIRSIPRLP